MTTDNALDDVSIFVVLSTKNKDRKLTIDGSLSLLKEFLKTFQNDIQEKESDDNRPSDT